MLWYGSCFFLGIDQIVNGTICIYRSTQHKKEEIMKKFLVGIVSLVAAVMLTSPAFGALEDPYYFPVIGVGTFSFDPGTVIADNTQVPHPPSDQNVLDTIGGWASSTDLGEIKFFQEFDTTGKDGYVNFDSPVQIIVAKWGGNPNELDSITSWAFLLEGYTTHFDWEGLPYGMSHVRGYNAVPVPAAAWLLGSGALGLVAIRRRRS
jgi:hypothetical protein